MSSTDWEWAQRHVPIVCVDVLPLSDPAGHASSQPAKIGLILRNDVELWGLVGGRVGRGETLKEAVKRHIDSTLVGAQFSLDAVEPVYMAEYFPGDSRTVPDRNAYRLSDPRRHAVAITYCIPMSGEISARQSSSAAESDAKDFQWFELDSLPPPKMFGFDQDLVVHQCLARIGHSPSSPHRS